jgi:UDP-3-O-[3-hydroxymyristoyl] glucosamine N-acyltransferase
VSVTLRQLADLVQGEVHGDGDLLITAARPMGEAHAGHITFVENDKHLGRLSQCQASAAVVPTSAPANGKALIRVADPLGAFVTIVRHLHGRAETRPQGIEAGALVHPSTRIGADACISALAVVGEGTVVGARCRIHSHAVIGRHCRIGDDVIIYPGAVLYDDTVLGNRVVVHANAVLGADGFGYRLQNGRHVKVPQLGSVEIGDDVEIGACTTIDRGAFQPTRVGAGTKIDNLVMIGHNCQIGPHNMLIGQVGIAGSCTTGAYVVMAAQVGVADHIHIGDGCIIGPQAGVIRDIPAGLRMLGAPATPERDQKRIMVTLEKLPEMRKTSGASSNTWV